MSTTPTPNPAPGAAPAGTPPKKSNVLWWILGIIGGLILVFILAIVGIGFFFVHKVNQMGDLAKKNPGLAAAKVMVTMNPDAEIVSSDDDAGTIVVRNKKDGKTVTMKFDPQKKSMVILDDKGKESSIKISGEGNAGNIEISSDKGSMKMGTGADAAPPWVPVYPGVKVQNTLSVTENGKQSGQYVFTTSDSADKVISYYSDAMKSAGLTVSTTTGNTDGKISGVVSGTDKDQNRTVAVVLGAESDGTHVGVTYSEKKQGI
ncbi:MAG TPA: hypothetical protein VN176_03815 [Verrucomicrobiae bacterium]|jgi:hypothetical protein|nr:hypothetical protein [Verrucomicrobiae bacterium]